MEKSKYVIMFKYDDSNEIYQLPIPPESFKTKVGNKNKTIELISGGEFNVIKDIGLREWNFKILLPRILEKPYRLPFIQDAETNNCIIGQPIVYLNKFREFKMSKKPVRMLILRVFYNGFESFQGNTLVSFEDYSVEENAGEEGDYWVELKLKEYRHIRKIELKDTGQKTKSGESIFNQEIKRETKETEKEYTVKQGDSLWKIAKLQLNDGNRYKEIAELNGITDYNNIKAGTILKLP